METFAKDMAAALKQKQPTDHEPYDASFENDLLTEEQPPSMNALQLVDAPQASPEFAFGSNNYEEEQRIEEEMMPELVQDFTTLTALTREIHSADGEKMQFIDLYENARPHDQLHKRKGEIGLMTEGKKKQTQTQLFNASVVMFKAAKADPEFRKWFAKFAKQTDDYYSLKKERQKLLIKIRLLNQIRNDKEMENFKEKQRKRREAEEEEANNGKRSRQRLN